jgi:hypothetical protein
LSATFEVGLPPEAMGNDVAVLDELVELGLMCGKVTEFQEGGRRFIHLERVTLPPGCNPSTLEGLLCPQERDGYQTRLFLSARVDGRGPNWTVHRILDREWHSWSWQGVPASQRLSQILADHVASLRS